jgi:hypothetical protein
MALSANSNTPILNSTSTKFPPAAGISQQRCDAIMNTYSFYIHNDTVTAILFKNSHEHSMTQITQSENKVRDRYK